MSAGGVVMVQFSPRLMNAGVTGTYCGRTSQSALAVITKMKTLFTVEGQPQAAADMHKKSRLPLFGSSQARHLSLDSHFSAPAGANNAHLARSSTEGAVSTGLSPHDISQPASA